MRPGLFACAATVAALVGTSHADLRYRPTDVGPWRPWNFSAQASARKERAATTAEVRAVEQRLRDLAALVRRAPAVARPVGFAGELDGALSGYRPSGAGDPAGKALPLSYQVWFRAFPLIEFERNGTWVNEDLMGGETDGIAFIVNQLDGGMFSGWEFPGEWSGVEMSAFLEPVTGRTLHGAVEYGGSFVLKRHDRPLWVPLSLADAFAPMLSRTRENLAFERARVAKLRADHATWLTPAARAARRAQRERTARDLAELRRTSPSAPDPQEYLANEERSEREVEAAMNDRLRPGGPEESRMAELERDLRDDEAARAGFTAAQLAGPSCYFKTAPSPALRFQPVTGAAGCRPLVQPNWAYFDRTLPRSVPQVLMLNWYDRCLRPEAYASPVRGGCAINRELVESLDWDAVRAWLAR